jgi:transcriptional regulator with XRE-family HTH domain
LPFRRISLKATKPEALVDQGDTLAAHLRRARRERGLKQIEVAEIMSVSETSIVDWEASKQPHVRMYPAIIAFLGYEPWPEPASIGEHLKAERHRRGWSIKRTAAILQIDEGTFAGWERQTRNPTRPSRTLIDAFLAGND